jgi:hypothetical protein
MTQLNPMRRLGVFLVVLAMLMAIDGMRPRAESTIPPTLPQFLRDTSAYIVRATRVNVSRRVFPLGSIAWHAFRIEEVLSRRQPNKPGAPEWDGCIRTDRPDAPVQPGEVALPFGTWRIVDAENGPFGGSDDVPPVGARFLAFVVECSPTIMKFPYVDRGLVRINDDGTINPTLLFLGGGTLRSVAETRERIAEIGSVPRLSQ